MNTVTLEGCDFACECSWTYQPYGGSVVYCSLHGPGGVRHCDRHMTLRRLKERYQELHGSLNEQVDPEKDTDLEDESDDAEQRHQDFIDEHGLGPEDLERDL